MQPNTRGLIAENLIKRKTYNDLSNLKLDETSIYDLLKRQLVRNLQVNPNSMQSMIFK
jgi:hypothetical protein